MVGQDGISSLTPGQGSLPGLFAIIPWLRDRCLSRLRAQVQHYFILETLSAMAASSGSICRKGPASASAPEMLGTTSFTVSPYVSALGMAGTGCPEPGEGLPGLGITILGSPRGGTVFTRQQHSLLSLWDAIQLHVHILYSCLLARGVLLFFLDLLG